MRKKLREFAAGALVRYSKVADDPEPNASKIQVASTNVIVLYTGHVPWVLYRAADGTLRDSDGKEVFLWEF